MFLNISNVSYSITLDHISTSEQGRFSRSPILRSILHHKEKSVSRPETQPFINCWTNDLEDSPSSGWRSWRIPRVPRWTGIEGALVKLSRGGMATSWLDWPVFHVLTRRDDRRRTARGPPWWEQHIFQIRTDPSFRHSCIEVYTARTVRGSEVTHIRGGGDRQKSDDSKQLAECDAGFSRW